MNEQIKWSEYLNLDPPKVDLKGLKGLDELPDRYMCLCEKMDGSIVEVKMIWANYWQDECGWRVGAPGSSIRYRRVISWRLIEK